MLLLSAPLRSHSKVLSHNFWPSRILPRSQSNNNFQQLMTRISASEDSISDRREFYNEAVNLNNTRREEFPDLVVARMFGFAAADLLTFDPEELKDVISGIYLTVEIKGHHKASRDQTGLRQRG